MRRISALFVLSLSVLVSCKEWDDKWNAIVNQDYTQGTEPMSSIELGRYLSSDRDAIEEKWKKETPNFSRYPLVPYMSVENIDALAESGSLVYSDYERKIINTTYAEDGPVLCRLDFQPFLAKISKVTVTVRDASVVSFRKTDDLLTFYMDIHKVGETDVTVVAEGLNTLERHYHIRIVGKVALQLYTDPFWMNDVIARLKYKTKALPPGVSKMYMNVRDSATVFGLVRMIDQRRGDATFRSKVDTTAFALRQHTDRFRKNKRVILRNVSSAVKRYNVDFDEKCWIRVTESDKERYSGLLSGSIPYTVKRNGDVYVLEMLGQRFTIDKYQLHWINRTAFLFGSWPAKRSFEKVGDQWYLTFREPYVCKQVQLCLNVIPDNEYIIFEHSFKRNQEPSRTDDDEDDDSDDFTDEQETVVDSLGTRLMDYFTFTFEDGLDGRRRDSLARVLDRLTKETSDSTKWKLYYDSKF